MLSISSIRYTYRTIVASSDDKRLFIFQTRPTWVGYNRFNDFKILQVITVTDKVIQVENVSFFNQGYVF